MAADTATTPFQDLIKYNLTARSSFRSGFPARRLSLDARSSVAKIAAAKCRGIQTQQKCLNKRYNVIPTYIIRIKKWRQF
jgi:hypothetical protein